MSLYYECIVISIVIPSCTTGDREQCTVTQAKLDAALEKVLGGEFDDDGDVFKDSGIDNNARTSMNKRKIIYHQRKVLKEFKIMSV